LTGRVPNRALPPHSPSISPWLYYRCGDGGYGDAGAPSLERTASALPVDSRRFLFFSRPRPLLPLDDVAALSRAVARTADVRVLECALDAASAEVRMRRDSGVGLLSPPSAVAETFFGHLAGVARSATYSGRTLFAFMRRTPGRRLARQACEATGGQMPPDTDRASPCLACDISLGNVTAAFLVHDTVFFSAQDWDCALKAPALAVSFIDGLAVAAAVAAGRFSNDDVHRVVSVFGNAAIRDEHDGRPPAGAPYRVRTYDEGSQGLGSGP
jgi:hypothetical protein